MKQVQLAIIGGGPAGLAAAIAARENGVEDILIIERDKELGSTSVSTRASACTPSVRS